MSLLFASAIVFLAALPTLMAYWNLPQFHRAADVAETPSTASTTATATAALSDLAFAVSGAQHAHSVSVLISNRRAGLMTDIIDARDIASVRMYHGWSSVMQGLRKNASEGIANVRLIVPVSVLLLGSGVLPALLLPHAIYHTWPLLR